MSRFGTVFRRRQRGIALVLVLWVLILLGLIAASFLRETRLGTNLARNVIENAKAEALADAGIHRAMLGLLEGDPAARWRADGTAYSLALGEGVIIIRIEDENGKVDVNRAPAPLLRGLLEAAGADPDTALGLADAISDFRDPDHERRPAGAEDADYLAAELPEGAKDAPFDDTDELMQVLGMRRAIYDSIRPYVTVYSGRGRVNLFTAPEFVLRAIPNLAPEQLERIRTERESDERLQRTRADTVTVRAEATTQGGGAFTREAVVRRTGDPEHPFRVLDWRQAWRSAPDVSAAGDGSRQ